MDTLVAQYSKPMFEKENYDRDDQMQMYQPTPTLSLRFAMPPIAQVRFDPSFSAFSGALISIIFYLVELVLITQIIVALSLAPCSNRRLCEPELPDQDCTRYYNFSIQISRGYHRSDRFESHSRELDR